MDVWVEGRKGGREGKFKNFETPLYGQMSIFSKYTKVRRKKVKGIGNVFNEIIVQNFSNHWKDMDIHIHVICKTPNRYDQK
jgi:hypothetical protein